MFRDQILKHLPGARKGKGRGSKGEVRRGATARGAMEKSGRVRVTKGEEVRRKTQSNTSSPRESEAPPKSQRGRWQPKSPKIKISPEEERIEGEKESVLPSVG